MKKTIMLFGVQMIMCLIYGYSQLINPNIIEDYQLLKKTLNPKKPPLFEEIVMRWEKDTCISIKEELDSFSQKYPLLLREYLDDEDRKIINNYEGMLLSQKKGSSTQARRYYEQKRLALLKSMFYTQKKNNNYADMKAINSLLLVYIQTPSLLSKHSLEKYQTFFQTTRKEYTLKILENYRNYKNVPDSLREYLFIVWSKALPSKQVLQEILFSYYEKEIRYLYGNDYIQVEILNIIKAYLGLLYAYNYDNTSNKEYINNDWIILGYYQILKLGKKEDILKRKLTIKGQTNLKKYLAETYKKYLGTYVLCLIQRTFFVGFKLQNNYYKVNN